MSDIEIVLGELKEFKRATLQELECIKGEVKDLSAFKWQLAGILSFVVLCGEALHLYVRLKN